MSKTDHGMYKMGGGGGGGKDNPLYPPPSLTLNEKCPRKSNRKKTICSSINIYKAKEKLWPKHF